MPHFVVGSILGVFYAWPTGPITAGARAVLAAWPVQPSGSCVRWNCLGPGPCPDMILGSILGNQPCFAGCGHWVCHVPGSPKWPLVYTGKYRYILYRVHTNLIYLHPIVKRCNPGTARAWLLRAASTAHGWARQTPATRPGAHLQFRGLLPPRPQGVAKFGDYEIKLSLS